MKKTFLVMMLVATSGTSNALAEENLANPRFDDYYTVRESISPNSENFTAPWEAALDLIHENEEFFTELRSRLYSLVRFDHHTDGYGNVGERYDRAKHFGGWLNDHRDDNCHNTRAKVLMRDSEVPVGFASNGCTVSTGQWQDPYGDRQYSRASDIQIDHFVPLKNAYISGAHKWNRVKRCLYSNYLGNEFHLLSVFGKENASKSDKTPEGYMPPNPAYRCQYLVQWLKVKMIWSLGLTPPEKDTVLRLASENRCDLNEFVYSEGDLQNQRRFMNDNMALCE
ncbi:HNH endonuclease family protein [Bdellovibrio bacteriovorus]|uniref:HNH endonuclease family protein n=1 Tax=Bdellovibrio bacteriovorus TaxID=959 RepID=UPI003AA9A080